MLDIMAKNIMYSILRLPVYIVQYTTITSVHCILYNVQYTGKTGNRNVEVLNIDCQNYNSNSNLVVDLVVPMSKQPVHTRLKKS